jgi:hypothetical protein
LEFIRPLCEALTSQGVRSLLYIAGLSRDVPRDAGLAVDDLTTCMINDAKKQAVCAACSVPRYQIGQLSQFTLFQLTEFQFTLFQLTGLLPVQRRWLATTPVLALAVVVACTAV